MVKQLTMPVMTRLILVTNGIGRDFPKWNKLNPAGIISGTGIDPGKGPATKSGWCTYNLSTQYILWPAWLLPIQQENDSTTGDGPSSYTLVNMPGSATHSLPLVHFVVVLGLLDVVFLVFKPGVFVIVTCSQEPIIHWFL